MNEEQSRLMLRIQQLGLTQDELREYLDTHPGDSFAIERFNSSVQAYTEALAQHAAEYGPLTWSCQNSAENVWLWAQQPFPWDY